MGTLKKGLNSRYWKEHSGEGEFELVVPFLRPGIVVATYLNANDTYAALAAFPHPDRLFRARHSYDRAGSMLEIGERLAREAVGANARLVLSVGVPSGLLKNVERLLEQIQVFRLEGNVYVSKPGRQIPLWVTLSTGGVGRILPTDKYGALNRDAEPIKEFYVLK